MSLQLFLCFTVLSFAFPGFPLTVRASVAQVEDARRPRSNWRAVFVLVRVISCRAALAPPVPAFSRCSTSLNCTSAPQLSLQCLAAQEKASPFSHKRLSMGSQTPGNTSSPFSALGRKPSASSKCCSLKAKEYNQSLYLGLSFRWMPGFRVHHRDPN